MRRLVNPAHHRLGNRAFFRKIFKIPQTLVVEILEAFRMLMGWVKFFDIRVFAFFGIAAFLAVMFAGSVVKLYGRAREASAELKDLEEKIAALKKENEEIEKVLRQSAASPAFLEKEARRRLNLKKPGEKVVIIIPPKVDEIKDSGFKIKEDAQEKMSWWQKVKEFLHL